MAKRCTRCGNFLMDDERFCTRCGENVANIPPEGGSQYVSGNPQQPGAQYVNTTGQPAPQAPVYNYAPPPVQQQEEMSLGKWVLTIIVTTWFSFISLIFLFVWGFGDGPESRKRYCKAMLIIEAISLVLGIILSIAFAGIFAAIGSSLVDYIDRSGRYQYGTAAIMQMFGM